MIYTHILRDDERDLLAIMATQLDFKVVAAVSHVKADVLYVMQAEIDGLLGDIRLIYDALNVLQIAGQLATDSEVRTGIRRSRRVLLHMLNNGDDQAVNYAIAIVKLYEAKTKNALTADE